ncbi:carboxyl-terminal processing protease [Ereboglobus sp. PH5-10]|uniref:carboxy terminal-processing peptidase n=1 Tax=Ereboglobus sp. PH5-10 TaxID=2940629 RepID=UPI002406DDB1|nr:carboxy terminal-processing peptidase [Ereboglobus sp. PH5-10]MDF9828403.1 carboxyl-terminal processing protease [Ereboglobus sp. PH5-10]
MKQFTHSARAFSSLFLTVMAAALLSLGTDGSFLRAQSAAATAPQDRIFAPAPGFNREAASVVALLEQFHYNRNAVRPVDYAEIIPNFMADFDGQRLFFLESDKVAFTTRYSPRWVYNNLTSLGKTDPAYDIFNVYTRRVTNRINWALDKLDAITSGDLAGNDGYLYDRKDSPWPADMAEADTLWMQRLKNEIIGEMLNEKSLDDARANIRKRYERWLKNLADIEPKDISETYLTTVAHLYDPHTAYMSAETLEEFSIGIKLQLIGIGAVLSIEDDYCTIREIVVGGPADLSKQLQPKDKIIAVAEDGHEPVDVIGMKLRNVVQLIRGKKDTKVHLTVIPAADASQRKQVVITRDVVSLDASRARGAIHEIPSLDGKGTTPIGVITLPGFYDAGINDKGEPSPSATQDIARLITQFQQSERGIQGLVLDLRGNGGGLLSEAIKLTGLFVKAGPVVQVKNYYGQVQVDSSEAPEPLYPGPLAVLVSRFSASASEIVAGALQNYGRAIIVGDSSTHGKGTVQQLLEMQQLVPALARLNSKTGGVKLTIQKFYLPNGDSTQLKGVVSDIPLPSIDDYLPIGEKSLPRALAWDEITPSRYEGSALPPELLEALREASEKRQQTLEEFDYFRKTIDWFKTRQEQKILSLNLDERLAQQARDKAFKKEQDEERNRLAAAVGYASTEFLLGPPKEKTRKTSKTPVENTVPPAGAEPRPESAPDAGADKQPALPDQSSAIPKTLPDGIRLAGTSAAGSGNAETQPGAGTPDAKSEDDDPFSDEQLEEDAKKLDIHLRETLRVLNDAINMARHPGPSVAANAPAPLTAAAVGRH